MHKHTPEMYMFAGNNGSGKSTLRSLIIDKVGIPINIDPDAIALRLDPGNPEAKRITAGREVIRTVNEYLKQGKNFSIETTFSGNNAIRQIKKAKKLGYVVTLIYVVLRKVDQNIKRVAMRVENGGHPIPTEDIVRRNVTSFRTFMSMLIW
ncbi:Zeta toxin [Oceanobacillus picturae]|uniref:UDP-N-acetylglucosamine kinase n=1 Tax=Oceanobacillus picturae TaxID=171693 RepID=W9AEY1_9BACI|nr:zeta toxin family protein [Oceanobacillus picturae]CDO04279.1 Zeta toxin [Oceanobacillus picturae]